jgi:tetratricopeptide (TPR) repeat protein
LAFALFEQDGSGNIDRMIDLDERGLKIVDSLDDKDNSSRLYLHLGMYYAFKAQMYCKTDEKGQTIVTPDAREWLVKAIYILERAEPIDRAFDRVNRERDIKRGARADDEVDVGLDQIYSFLGSDYMNLGMLGQAEQTFRYMRQLSPTGADAYFKMGQVQMAQGRPDLAAISLIQCVLIDGDRMDGWKMLNDIYQHQTQKKWPEPPIMAGAGGHPVLNLNDPLVRMNLFDAYKDFVRIFRAANRQALVRQTVSNMLNTYKFPPDLVNAVMEEPVIIPVPAPPIYYKPGTKADIPGGTMQ